MGGIPRADIEWRGISIEGDVMADNFVTKAVKPTRWAPRSILGEYVEAETFVTLAVKPTVKAPKGAFGERVETEIFATKAMQPATEAP